jgi:energy-coupling factor transporter ATP-binding protein EcfA2
LIANFHKERNLFERLLSPDSRDKILLLEGDSGAGKTTLLNCCIGSLPENLPHVPIQFRTTAVGVAEVFFRSGKYLSWNSLSRFSDQLEILESPVRVDIKKNWLAGINNRINIALYSEDPVDREYRRAALTDAWFDDLDAFPSPILITLDAYEHATTEVREWIDGPFLSRVAQAKQVRAMVAGQVTPDINNIEWGRACVKCSLLGVPEAKDWMPVVEYLEKDIPLGDPLTWLAGVCHALKGRPKDIMQVIEALQRKGEIP